ncbi:MAG: biotin/lipoyl-binding protein [Chloroflexi bacterium]|nr:biotin/lipoyl-binding protein [Chloroflexota bacterium]
MKYIVTVNEREYTVEIVDERRALLDGRVVEVDFEPVGGQPLYSLLADGKSFEAYVYPGEEALQVLLMGQLYQVTVEDEREKRLRAAAGGRVAESGEYHLKAPMPGLVVAIPVQDGQAVEKGQALVILESMKMQNELKAPRAGVVGRIRVRERDSVEQRQTLLSVQ